MKTRIIHIPKTEQKLSKEDELIKYLGDKTLSHYELTKSLNIKSHGLLSEMVRYGKLERLKCESCHAGIKYRVKK